MAYIYIYIVVNESSAGLGAKTAMKTSRFTFKPPAGPQRDTQEKVWSALDKATKNRQPMCVHILIYTKQTKNTKRGRFSTIDFQLFS